MGTSSSADIIALKQLLFQAQPELVAEQLQNLKVSSLSIADQAQLENLRGVTQQLLKRGNAELHFRRAMQLDLSHDAGRMNLELLCADALLRDSAAPGRPEERATRVAVLSFLFNWPSTGGGNVHTAELCDFLQRFGYEVSHFYARFDPWELGVVTEDTPVKSQMLNFKDSEWNAATIKKRYRQAVDSFQPDYVIITDSWNMKPVLAEAMQGYPYIMRLQALECLCPLNNIRLLPAEGGGVRQCSLNQLATPDECNKCLSLRSQRSGSLHQAERQLAGVGTPEYQRMLIQAFKNAHCVFANNPLIEAMVAAYAKDARTVTSGMDPMRFPDPWPDDPVPPATRTKKQILFAGLMNETIKGFVVLHEACQLLWQHRQDFELLVTADPVGTVDHCTRTVGWQTQQTLPRVMRSVDIVAVPAIAQEALGRTAVEAMGASRPVVASRVGGLPFTIPDGGTGLLVEPGNPHDLAEKLNRLLDDSSLRKSLGEAGRRRFLEHFAWPAIIEKQYFPVLGLPRRSTHSKPTQ